MISYQFYDWGDDGSFVMCHSWRDPWWAYSQFKMTLHYAPIEDEE